MQAQRLLIAAAFAAALASPSTGHAQTTASTQADRAALYQKAREAMTAKNWPEAHRLFSLLWDRSHTYDVALGLGQVELNLKRYRDAAEHVAYGLRNMPAKENPELEDKARNGLEVAKQQVGTVHVTVDRAGAEILVDGVAAGTSPLGGELYVDPGTHRIEAHLADQMPAQKTIAVRANDEPSVDLQFSEPTPHAAATGVRAETSPPETADRSVTAVPQSSNAIKPRTIAVLSGAGVTAVAAGIGILFAVKGNSASGDADTTRREIGSDTCIAASNPLCGSLRTSLQDRKNDNEIANISFAVAGVAAVATAALFFLWPKRDAVSWTTDDATPNCKTRLRLIPVAGRGSNGLVVRGSF